MRKEISPAGGDLIIRFPELGCKEKRQVRAEINPLSLAPNA
jgi:hypothetical protein